MGGDLLRRIPPARPYLAATVVVGLLVAIVTVAQMAFLSEIVDRVFLEGGGSEHTFTLLSLLAATAVLRAGLLWVRETTAQRGAIRVKNDLREQLFAHVLHLGPAYARSERSGELTTTLTEGVERLDPYFARYLPQVFLSVSVILLIVGYILPRDIASAVLLVVTAPVIPVKMILVGSYAEEHTRRQWFALSRMGAHFLDALQGLPTLKVFGRVAAEEEKVERVSGEFRERTLKVLRYAFLSGLVLEFMTAAAIALVAVVLGGRLLTGLATPATFWVSPEMLRSFNERPYGYVLPLVAVAGLMGMVYFNLRGRDREAFLSSGAYIVGMLTSTVFGVYPKVLPAVDPANSLTVQNASASAYGMTVGLVWWSIGMVLAVVYFTVIYRLFRGKIRL